MKKRLFRSLGLLLPLLLTTVFGQDRFDNYAPLQSKGPVPEDFSIATSQKIRNAQGERRDGLTSKQQKVFVEQVNYSIDELLKSGLVTYGDEVSTYIQMIGDRLTAGEPDLAGQLRFYTLNTNEANAFSTDQGMVFVTTGLIAQMTNEAQLAFVLAHEIVHYQEEHVLDLYDYVTDNNRSLSYYEKVRFFSKYSRDNEFEADKLGVKLYHKAGYASSEITKTFDVLIYSYLPFEEFPLRKDYFNTKELYVPEKAFGKRKNDITARQTYNDRFTTHPNVAKRIEALEKEIAAYADWGTVLNYPERSFTEVRAICRFESLLNQVYDNKATDALYSIYVLEQDYPDSRFLGLCKAQIWLELMKDRSRAMDYNPFTAFRTLQIPDYSSYEGEISVLDRFLTDLPDEGKVALGLRFIHDIYRKDTSDALIGRMWQKAIEMAAMHSDFDPDRFSKLNFTDAIAKLEAARLAEKADTTGTVSQRWDKYETIKNQRSGLTIDAGIDSSKFYLYGIADLLSDSLFNRQLAACQQKQKEKERKEEDQFALTDEEIFNIEQVEYEDRLHLGLDSVLFVNPLVTEYRGYDRIDFPKSDKLEQTLLEAVRRMSTDRGIAVTYLDRTQLQSMTTQQYNDMALVMRTVEKGIETSEPDVFMIDLERLDSLKLVYGSSKVMMMTLDHAYNNHITPGLAVVYTVLFPLGAVYFPIALLTAHTTQMNVYVMDLEKGTLLVNEGFYSQDPASRKLIEARLHSVFNQFKEPAFDDTNN